MYYQVTEIQKFVWPWFKSVKVNFIAVFCVYRGNNHCFILLEVQKWLSSLHPWRA